MKKILGSLVAGILCVSCASPPDSDQQDTAFKEHPMTPLYLFQNTEELENVPLKVMGTIPEWLEGEFVHNGPGLVQGPKGSIRSWFDGLAKLHAFTLHQGQVAYTCKFLKSNAYQNFLATGEFDFLGFAQQPKTDTFSYYDFIFGIENKEIINANVNVSKINNRLVALTEIPLPVEFDRSLNTIAPFNYTDDLPKNYSFESAHILEDPETKAMWNFLINIGFFDTEYQIYKIPAFSSERQLVASIPVSSMSYMHSFSLAGRYFVLVDYPLRAKKPQDVVDGFIQAFSWYDKEPTVVYVVDRDSGQVWSFCTESFFSFHHINGFEKEGKVYIDLIAYPNADIIYKVNGYPFVKNPENKVLRLEMDLLCHTIKTRELSRAPIEFPRLNGAMIGKEYQYFYGVHIFPDGDGIIKFNPQTLRHQHWFEKGLYATEPIFVPHPQARTEDEGVILTIVNNIDKKQSFLLILNAVELKELARVPIPHFVPFGFHGQFFKECP
jgi:carotenoid cleavage dioxygenase-like enzyme